jgi:hypothetical protein
VWRYIRSKRGKLGRNCGSYWCSVVRVIRGVRTYSRRVVVRTASYLTCIIVRARLIYLLILVSKWSLAIRAKKVIAWSKVSSEGRLQGKLMLRCYSILRSCLLILLHILTLDVCLLILSGKCAWKWKCRGSFCVVWWNRMIGSIELLVLRRQSLHTTYSSIWTLIKVLLRLLLLCSSDCLTSWPSLK